VIDLDAHVLVCHSEKEQTAATFKHSFGYHPLLAFLDNTGEFSPPSCAQATPDRTPPPTTSPSLTRR
jgi:hypothetical protein